MKPNSVVSAEIEQNPAFLGISKSVENIEAAKKRKEEILNQCVQELSNLNLIQELIEAHQGKTNFEDVKTKQKAKFQDFFKKISEQNDIVLASNDAIKQNYQAFANLKKSIAIDPANQQFYQRIELSLACQQDLENQMG